MKQARPSITPSKRALIERIANEVLKLVKPTEKEMKAATFYSNELMGRLKSVVPKNVEIVLVGSVARGTQIRGSSDIDIFLLFPKSMEERKMEELGLKYGKGIVKKGQNESFIIKYAEHPYVKVLLKNENIAADIVPAFKISNASEMGSAVDRTQLHNEFVNAKLSKKQRDDVRIMKTFLNANNIYGAEARIEGFSGYLCELLVYHYGSFINAIEHFSSTTVPVVIDPLNKGKDIQNIKELKSRFNKNIIVVDPTDRNRNVAANVSDASLARLMLVSRRFIREPKASAFMAKGYSDKESKEFISGIKRKTGLDLYLLVFNMPDITEDILWQQLKRLRNGMESVLEHEGFPSTISTQNISEKHGIICFMIRNAKRESVIVKGPSIFMESACAAFLNSHSNAMHILIENDRLFSVEKPRFATPKELAGSLVSGKNISFPSYIKNKGAKLFVNKIPEQYSRLVHESFQEKLI